MLERLLNRFGPRLNYVLVCNELRGDDFSLLESSGQLERATDELAFRGRSRSPRDEEVSLPRERTSRLADSGAHPSRNAHERHQDCGRDANQRPIKGTVGSGLSTLAATGMTNAAMPTQ